MYRIVPSVKANLHVTWKFYENALMDFTAMLLTDTSQRLDGRLWNSLGRCETV